MVHKLSVIRGTILAGLIALTGADALAQQDPQYTQYMYNTMSVNPAYAGQREVLSVTGLYRAQWVGLDGAPDTQTLGIHAPLNNERIGLGLSIVNDALGPADETYADANFSYTVPLDRLYTKMTFGVKAGVHALRTDWSRGRFRDPDAVFNEDVSRFSPTVGAGIYLHNRRGYFGLSVPNIITTQHYDDFQESLAEERLHLYAIGGYVFDIGASAQFKPAALVKAVRGAPLIFDLSANFLFSEKFTVGLAYRWDDAVSGLAGFQVSESIYIGYAYDASTTGLNNYNSGSHEIMLRFEIQKLTRILSPRFF